MLKIAHYIALIIILVAPLTLVYALPFGARYLIISPCISAIGLLLAFLIPRVTWLRITSIVVFLGLLIIVVYAIDQEAKSKRAWDLGTAVLHHDLDLIKCKIAEGYDVNGKTKGGLTMLTQATNVWFTRGTEISGKNRLIKLRGKLMFEKLKVLLENGARNTINTIDDFGKKAPLHYIAYNAGVLPNDQLRIMNLLFSYGADPNLKDGDGEAPLHIAISDSCSMEIVEVLVQNGADVNAKNANGKTPLQIAIEKGRTDIAEYLREHGAKE